MWSYCSGFRGGRGERVKKGRECESGRNERKSVGVGVGVGWRSNGGGKGGED
jgi:hypothetical protein